MKEQIAIQQLLQTRFDEARRKNASYSIRGFAKKLGLHSGAVSTILSGKRNVSATLARRICERLMLDPQERMEILSLFPEKRAYKKEGALQDTVDPTYLQLSAAQYRVVGEWQHFAILTLMRTKNFQSDTAWIASRLNLSEAKVEQAITRLISIGTLERTAEGRLVRNPQKFRTTDDVVDMSVRRSHAENMDLAKDALEQISIHERDFTHVTLAVDPEKMSMAKELIRKFQDEFAQLVESGNATEVYRFSMQYFPLSKISTENEK